jgi:hypothetical protein
MIGRVKPSTWGRAASTEDRNFTNDNCHVYACGMRWGEQSLWICASLLTAATVIDLAMGPDRRTVACGYLLEVMAPAVADIGDVWL